MASGIIGGIPVPVDADAVNLTGPSADGGDLGAMAAAIAAEQALTEARIEQLESDSGTSVPVDKFPTLAANRVPDPQAVAHGDAPSSSRYAMTRITTGLPAGFGNGAQTTRQGTLDTVVGQFRWSNVTGPVQIPVAPGEVVSVGCLLWSDQADSRGSVSISYLNSSGASVGSTVTSAYTPLAASTWERRTLEGVTVPAGAATAYITGNVITVSGNASEGDVCRFTGAMLSPTPTLPEYGDGSFQGWVWTGEPHASASRKIIGTSGGGTGTTDAADLIAWATAEAFVPTGSIVRNADGIITSAAIVWPDGSGGAFTATDTTGGYLNAYTATHVDSGRKVTQPAVTRNAAGDVTAVPTPTVGAI